MCYCYTGITIYLHIHVHTEKKRESYFKGLDHAVTEAGESQISRVVWQAGGPGKRQRCSSSPKIICCQNSLSFQKYQSFTVKAFN